MSLSLHEGNPGHHLQSCFLIEAGNIPEFRQYLEDRMYATAPSRFPFHTAYIEGWGLYSETLGHDLGLYGDPYDRFVTWDVLISKFCSTAKVWLTTSRSRIIGQCPLSWTTHISLGN
jgi:uncharacterized protein (DUF885 family)